MLVFSHIGITLTSAALGFRLLDGLRHEISQDGTKETFATTDSSSSSDHPSNKISFFGPLANRLDIRFLLVGSLLPDIIDKPIGIYFFRETFGSGRIFSHTLLFLASITAVGLMLKRYSGKTWGLALSLGTVFHLILDGMWLTPKTLLWPLFGIGFEKHEIDNWVMNLLHGLLQDPKLYVPEIIGFLLTMWFVWELLNRRVVTRFIRKGKVY